MDTIIWIAETYVNKTEGYVFSETEPYESWATVADKSQLFQKMQREYGRCVSHVYVDHKDGTSPKVGWVFERVDKYEDTHETYLREVWVHLFYQDERHRLHNLYL